MNSYVGTVSPDTSICDGRHTWGELSGDSILILTRTKTFPGESESKAALEKLAKAEDRTIGNLVNRIVAEYLRARKLIK